MDDAVRKYLNVTSYYGQQVEMDNQARLLLPQILRMLARLDAEVTVFGMRTYLEVHNREIFEENLAANELTAEDRKAMAEILAARVNRSVSGPAGPNAPQGERMTKQSERHVPVLLKMRLSFSMCARAAPMQTARSAWRATRQKSPGGSAQTDSLIGFDRDPEALDLPKPARPGRAELGERGAADHV